MGRIINNPFRGQVRSLERQGHVRTTRGNGTLLRSQPESNVSITQERGTISGPNHSLSVLRSLRQKQTASSDKRPTTSLYSYRVKLTSKMGTNSFPPDMSRITFKTQFFKKSASRNRTFVVTNNQYLIH